MNRRQKITAGIGTLLFSILSTSVLGQTIVEQGSDGADGNSVITSAQAVESSSGTIVIAGDLFFTAEFDPIPFPGMLVFRRDVDFYSFFASAGNQITLDIDGGFGGASDVDTKLSLFGLAPSYPKLAENDDAGLTDDGSTSIEDPFINKFLVPADGIYTVAVTSKDAMLVDGGEVLGGDRGRLANGDYLLKISGLSSPSARVEIAVAPGKLKKKAKKGKKAKVAHINLKKKRHVKVAILGSKDFPVSGIDTRTLTFGAVGNEKTLRKCKRRTKDFNRDGEADLECEFSLRNSGFGKNSREGILSGQTWDGRPFSGADRIKVKGKRKG